VEEECEAAKPLRRGGEEEMKTTLVFKLVRQARRFGGDRYEAELEGEYKPWVLYIPQAVSRVDEKVADAFEVTFKDFSKL